MLRLFILASASLGLASSALLAQEGKPVSPPVDFDTSVSFLCRDVTPKDFPATSPDTKVVEASVRISANFTVNEKEIESLVYKIKLPTGIDIADYLPKTEVATDIASNIDRRQNNSSKDGMVVSLEAGGKVGFKVPGAFDSEASGSAGRKADQSTEVTSAIQVSQLPPKQLVTAAGTEDRGQTIYFKLRPFSQKTLEGNRDFAILLVVPKAWSGDHVELRCLAWKKGSEAVAVEKVVDFALVMRGDAATRRRLESEVRKAKSVLKVGESDSGTVKPSTPAAPPNDSDAAKAAVVEGKYRFCWVIKDAKGEDTAFETIYEAVFSADGTWEGKAKTRGRTNGGMTGKIYNMTMRANKFLAPALVPGVGDVSELLVRGSWTIGKGSLTLKQTNVAPASWAPWIEKKAALVSEDPITNRVGAKDDIRLKSGIVLEYLGHN